MVPKTWLVIGAGFVGEALIRSLVAGGASVIATRRTPAGAMDTARRTGARVSVLDVAEAELSLPVMAGPFVAVYTGAPSDSSGAAEQRLVTLLAAKGCVRAIYVSSTGVYPAAAGAVVDELTLPGPGSPRGEARLAAERAFLATARALDVSAAALRAAGIYGPGRGVYARMKAGTFRLIGPSDTLVSRIHVDDLVTAIRCAGESVALAYDVFNAADDEPTSGRVFARACADALGIDAIPEVGLDEVSTDVRTMMTADRFVSNRRLRESLGVRLRYPTWREGLAALTGS